MSQHTNDYVGNNSCIMLFFTGFNNLGQFLIGCVLVTYQIISICPHMYLSMHTKNI